MEYFDVLDKNRNFTGKTYLRGTKLKSDEFNAGVEIYITCNNKLLMTKRCELKSHPLEWEVPGGCIIASDNSLKTIKKEIKEEIGIKLDKVIYIDTLMYKNQFVDIYTINLDTEINNFTLQKEEVNDIKWVSEKDFKEMASNNDIVKSVYDRFKTIIPKIELDWHI